MKVGRNDPCPCGSGLKNKQCCENEAQKKDWPVLSIGIVLLVLIAGGLYAGMQASGTDPQENAPPGKVWSEEHGHYHDAIPTSRGAIPQPAGPAPPGKIWSPEHGHWHDMVDGKDVTEADPADTPPGKVWSEEHGHFHDAPEGQAGIPASGQPPSPESDPAYYGTSGAPAEPPE